MDTLSCRLHLRSIRAVRTVFGKGFFAKLQQEVYPFDDRIGLDWQLYPAGSNILDFHTPEAADLLRARG